MGWLCHSRSSRANLQLIEHPSGMRNPSCGKIMGVFSVGYGRGIGINKRHEMNPQGLRAVTMFLRASVVLSSGTNVFQVIRELMADESTVLAPLTMQIEVVTPPERTAHGLETRPEAESSGPELLRGRSEVKRTLWCKPANRTAPTQQRKNLKNQNPRPKVASETDTREGLRMEMGFSPQG